MTLKLNEFIGLLYHSQMDKEIEIQGEPDQLYKRPASFPIKTAKDYITNILLAITMLFFVGTIIAIIVVYSI